MKIKKSNNRPIVFSILEPSVEYKSDWLIPLNLNDKLANFIKNFRYKRIKEKIGFNI